jgi:predicted ATPase
MGDRQPLQLRFDPFELDESDARLTRGGRPVALPPKAFAVLCALARQPGQLVTKSALLDAVWGHQHVSESVLKTTISELRAALSDDAKQPRYIETASRRGYRFIASANAQQAAAATRTPQAEAAQPHLEIVGRRDARARLRAAWNQTTAGRRQMFWVAGEAGVGKSTLIDSFVSELAPIKCAHGQCVEQFGAGEPYLPVLEAIAGLCRGDPTLAPMMRAVAPTWLLQLPWLSNEAERESLRRGLAGTSSDRMLRELAELLDQYTAQQPLLLVTEDLHWGDHATVRLIDYIARRRNPARLMWLGSFRLAELVLDDHPLKGLRHELRMHRLCQEIVLDPFSEQELADYIDARFPGSDFPEAFVRRLHAHTDGLPLFVVNVIDDLVSQGAMECDRTQVSPDPAAPWQVPENLAGVMEKRIARLSGEVRSVLEAASVCGMEFRPQTIADALERDVRWVGERCDELVRQQHWIGHVALGGLPDGSLGARYAFRHALYRHVFYQRIGALTRAQLHRNVAQSMERSRAVGVAVTAAELASHYDLGHDPMGAVRHYVDAADGALKQFAQVEAVHLTAQAAALLPRCPEDPRDSRSSSR